ncbi:TolC family protein [Granulicella sibirica]|uniref:Outer membrane component of tripartite multidrug resistance system n=1 Tax=Granulicella sibirica TaxID=2479048 RepID=A0A4Q0T6T7_9BACT|nr:TolC family protein [Granulicella sibirica]RXH57828.1 Outer membrane component of tripartite multidrug resistance system [Granulicella sibirica]
METRTPHRILLAAALLAPLAAGAQNLSPSLENGTTGSIATPRPINPAAATTNPSARATQSLNPYLGSVPDGKLVPGVLSLSLDDAIDHGLKFNLGLIDSQQADATVRAQRERALATLLPQISARAQQTYTQLSYTELGLKLPAAAGFQLPPTSGGFGYSDARVRASSPIVNMELIARYKAQKALEAASVLSTKDSRDVVVFAVGAAYFQVVASQARLSTAQSTLASAQELERQVANQFKAELSPEIDTLRAQVELRTAEQRVTDAANDLEKDKLTLDRITGISLDQAWTPSHTYDYSPLPDPGVDAALAPNTRPDVASLKETVAAAQLSVKAEHAQRLPVLSFEGNYGGGGVNPANFNRVYEASARLDVPIFTSGRIRSDIHQAEANLTQRRAEYQDLQGRVAYDVRVAMLDAKASEAGVKVAEANKALAQRALTQSQDRFDNGVTNYLEVVQAQESLEAANENYIASLFSFNVAKISLARALGSSETRIPTFFATR